jgi:hypothetical protein
MQFGEPEPTRPAWDVSGIHGLHRVREWDVVTTVEAAGVTGERAKFVAISPSEVVIEEGPDDVELLAAAVERELSPPFRAEAVRRDGDLWAVAARKIELVELPGISGQELELATHGDERSLRVDGERTFGSIPALERPEHVTRAHRVDGEIWEIEVAPL